MPCALAAPCVVFAPRLCARALAEIAKLALAAGDFALGGLHVARRFQRPRPCLFDVLFRLFTVFPALYEVGFACLQLFAVIIDKLARLALRVLGFFTRRRQCIEIRLRGIERRLCRIDLGGQLGEPFVNAAGAAAVAAARRRAALGGEGFVHHALRVRETVLPVVDFGKDASDDFRTLRVRRALRARRTRRTRRIRCA